MASREEGHTNLCVSEDEGNEPIDNGGHENTIPEISPSPAPSEINTAVYVVSYFSDW